MKLATHEEEKQLDVKLEKEKEKKDCIDRILKRKEEAEDIKEIKLEVASEINHVKTDTKIVINKQREKERKKLEILKKLSKKKKMKKQHELEIVRMAMAEEMIDAE